MDTAPDPEDFDYPQAMREVDAALEAALVRYATLLPSELIGMGKLALHAPGKVMSWRMLADHGEEAPLPKWPLLVIAGYRAALSPQERHSWREALPAVVAVEIAIAAADLIDEAADNDPSLIIEKYGAGQALNMANLMLVMSQQILQRHAAEGNARTMAALGALQDMLVEAAVGQHLDMAYEKMGLRDVTPDMSGEMTDKKAGALMSGALRMGALMAGAEEKVVTLLARIGRQLGGIAQISNDIQDVLPQGSAPDDPPNEEGSLWPEPKTDLRQRKRTLPIVFALRAEADKPNALQIAFDKPTTESVDEEAMRRAVVEAGGLDFAYLVIDVYRNNAVEALDALEELRPGARQELVPLL
jgi:geranylgeranyl pyrophosphate synthase